MGTIGLRNYDGTWHVICTGDGRHPGSRRTAKRWRHSGDTEQRRDASHSQTGAGYDPQRRRIDATARPQVPYVSFNVLYYFRFVNSTSVAPPSYVPRSICLSLCPSLRLSSFYLEFWVIFMFSVGIACKSW